MQVEFLSKFSKDLDSITDQSVKDDVRNTILQVEAAKSQQEISNLKKLKGFKTAYRIRIGDYRIGLFIEKGTAGRHSAEFARIVHRRDIYKVFP